MGANTSNERPLRVLVVEDNPRLATEYRQALEREGGYAVHDYQDVNNVEEAKALISRQPPDIVLVDLGILETPQSRGVPRWECGVELVEHLRSQRPEITVVAVTMYHEKKPAAVRRLLELGVSLLSLDEIHHNRLSRPERILHHAVQLARAGGVAYSGVVAGQIPSVLRREPGDEGELTRREKDILRLIAAGRQNSEIAEAVGVEHATVKTYVSRIFKRLGVSNRTQAANWYRERYQNGDEP